MKNKAKKVIFQLKNFEKSYGYAQAVKVGKVLYISGTVSIDNEGNRLSPGDMKAQVDNIYQDIGKTLQAFDLSFDDVVKEAIFSTDLERFKREGLEIRAQYYKGHSLPASSAWIEVAKLAWPEFLVEIEAIAAFN
jgi:enamine deaminase RidA (YjgF/YER057c/UK114 family)